MIIDFYGNGGGSGSGVTPEEVQEQIQSALTPYWDSATTEDAISASSSTKQDNLVSGENIKTINNESILGSGNLEIQTGGNYSAGTNIDITDDVISVTGITVPTNVSDLNNDAGYITSGALEDYYTSAQTDSAITMAVSGKADASSVSANTEKWNFPYWNEQGIITGKQGIDWTNSYIYLNGGSTTRIVANANHNFNIYTPETRGNAGDILVSKGSGAPVWSAVTFISSADVQSQIDTKAADYTPTTGFSTINGSAITNGDNLVIDADLSGYWNSAETQAHIDSAYTSATTHIEDVERVTAAALNELHSEVDAISGASENYITSAYVNTALASYTPTSGFSTINGSAITAGGNLVIEGGSGSVNIIELTKAEYNALSAYTEDAIYVITDADAINMDDYATSAQVETQITSKGYVTSGDVNTALSSYTPTSGFSTINGSAITAGGNLVIGGGGDLSAYWTSAQTQTAITTATANMVSSTTVTNIWRGTQAQYDLIDPKDPNALYIILAS